MEGAEGRPVSIFRFYIFTIPSKVVQRDFDASEPLTCYVARFVATFLPRSTAIFNIISSASFRAGSIVAHWHIA
jgi:hypothetical protein